MLVTGTDTTTKVSVQSSNCDRHGTSHVTACKSSHSVYLSVCSLIPINIDLWDPKNSLLGILRFVDVFASSFS